MKSADSKVGRRHALEVSTPTAEFYMVGANEKDKEDWIGAVGKAIVRGSKTYTNDYGVEEDEE